MIAHNNTPNPMQLLKEKRLELRDRLDDFLFKADTGNNVLRYLSEANTLALMEFITKERDMAYEEGKKESNCPPHHFIPHKYEGNWGGATRPPNMKCTKCLSTQYF